jgi:hypothetical protein
VIFAAAISFFILKFLYKNFKGNKERNICHWLKSSPTLPQAFMISLAEAVRPPIRSNTNKTPDMRGGRVFWRLFHGIIIILTCGFNPFYVIIL